MTSEGEASVVLTFSISDTLVTLLEGEAIEGLFAPAQSASHRGFTLQMLPYVRPLCSKLAVLKVWPQDPWGSPRNLQKIH